MLNSRGFDLWADGYDRAVGLSDEDGSYPFAGYRDVLNRIYQRVLRRGKPKALDIGFGTGTLTARLYEAGCRVWGQDFSPKMIEIAREKMPEAKLYEGDFSQGLAEQIERQRYDVILATYSLHHLTDGKKAEFLKTLKGLLEPGGEILVGDVAFETRAELEACRRAAGVEWDDEEFYFVYDEMKAFFPEMKFEKMSHCAGVLRI